MTKETARQQDQDLDQDDHMNPPVTLSGAALALGYMNEFDNNPYPIGDFEALAHILCNHNAAASGRNLQVKYVEWQYYNARGHPHNLTANLSNILMAKARVERYEEALAVLKFLHAFEAIPLVEKDLATFLQNNPKLETSKATATEKAPVKKKPYTDATDIFEILTAIATEPAFFNLNNTLDELNGFLAGYKLMATENKTKLKNMGKFDQFSFFVQKELDKPAGEQNGWHALLSDEFGPTEGYHKFMEFFNKFKMKYKS